MTRKSILIWTLAIIAILAAVGLFDDLFGPEKPAPERSSPQQEVTKTPAEIDKALQYCLLPKAQYGQYSSYDGGKSAGALLEEGCPREFFDWMNSCEKKISGDDEKTCFTKAMILSQVAIKTFNK
jgi:hypothetical protein